MAGIGVISGVECVIFGNDPTVLGGALTSYAAKKWGHFVIHFGKVLVQRSFGKGFIVLF